MPDIIRDPSAYISPLLCVVVVVGGAAALSTSTLALALLLYFTGGVANPFVSLFLLPLAIAAVILPVGYSVILLTLSLFLFASLMADSVPLPPSPPKNGISPHTLALWLNFVISSSLLTGFIAYLANRLRSAEQQLQQQHELRERQEQILALGTLAAGKKYEAGWLNDAASPGALDGTEKHHVLVVGYFI